MRNIVKEGVVVVSMGAVYKKASRGSRAHTLSGRQRASSTGLCAGASVFSPFRSSTFYSAANYVGRSLLSFRLFTSSVASARALMHVVTGRGDNFFHSLPQVSER
ncbi:unnamed protein product [Ectocarpus sp. 13 AM-2016]